MQQQIEWIDKHQAAKCLKMSTRSVLMMASSGEIQSKRERDPDTNQMAVKLHAGDVERVRYEREHPKPKLAVQPAKLQPLHASNGDQWGAAVQALTAIAEREAPVRLAERLYLTIGEAAELSGLGVGYLRRQIAERKLELVKGAGPRRADVVRRTELEKL